MKLEPSECEAVVELSPQMVWRCDAGGARDFFNRTWLEFTGQTFDQAAGDGWRQVVHPEDIRRFLKAYVGALDQRRVFEVEYRLRRRDGAWRWISDKAVPYAKSDGRFAGLIGSSIDIHERFQEEHLKDLALLDGLTGLYRRRYFEERLDEEIRRCKRYHADLALIKLDVDDFQGLSNKYGRAAADKVLEALAHIVRENTRNYDIACRLGGDEFCLALPQATAQDGELTAGRLRDLARNQVVTFDRQPVEFSVSFAVVGLTDEISAGKLVSRADRALCDSKLGRLKSAA